MAGGSGRRHRIVEGVMGPLLGVILAHMCHANHKNKDRKTSSASAEAGSAPREPILTVSSEEVAGKTLSVTSAVAVKELSTCSRRRRPCCWLVNTPVVGAKVTGELLLAAVASSRE